jgi:glycosyltransferase involved in cell wall biosynthesis
VTTVHLVYPHGARISAPDAIGRQLGQRLERHYPVSYYDWDEAGTITPARNDVLLGHPHPHPLTRFRRALGRPGWRRILALAPYHHGDARQVAFLDGVLARCDQFLAITGNYWYASIKQSSCAHWFPKMVHLDLAVDRHHFPVLKRSFSPPGQRRFVYIGHSGWTKNTAYLSEIARALPDARIGWIGRGPHPIEGLEPLGFQDFATEAGRQRVAAFDFMLTVGTADANPTTVLEAMAWGLIPVCTPQSGYSGFAGIANIPAGRAGEAAAILRRLQEMPDAGLRDMQAANWQALDAHFNWDRFAQQVIAAIESDARPPLGPASLRRRLALQWSAATSPLAPWRPLNLVRPLARRWLRRRANRGKGQPLEQA